MINSSIYRRQKRLNEYAQMLSKFEKRMRSLTDDSLQKKWLKSHPLLLCRYNNSSNTTFLASLTEMITDYFNRTCKYSKDSTMFDICLRENINRFKAVFCSPGTHSILEAFYEYVSKVPNYILVKGKRLGEADLSVDCYFRHYINLFFCYDILTCLVENYRTLTLPDQMTFVELLIDDIAFLLNTIFNKILN